MKRKINIGSQKCLQHTIEDTVQEVETNPRSSKRDAGSMVAALKQVEDSLDYYWDNLRELSGGSPNRILGELEPVMAQLKRVQEKIGRFCYDNPVDPE
jgi:hypothetical protein